MCELYRLYWKTIAKVEEKQAGVAVCCGCDRAGWGAGLVAGAGAGSQS